jgi:hypothetical protein
MGILEELEPKRNSINVIGDYLDSLDKKEREDWENVLLDLEKFSSRSISAALARRNIKVNENAVYRFRTRLMEARNAR